MCFLPLYDGFYLIQIPAVLDSLASVRQLSRFYNPARFIFIFTSPVIFGQKFQILLVLKTCCYVVSQRDVNLIVWAFLYFLKVHHHDLIQSFFVAYCLAELKMVSCFGRALQILEINKFVLQLFSGTHQILLCNFLLPLKVIMIWNIFFPVYFFFIVQN
jgi:hypothetical protein